ncbi:Qat anti-phage system TatD family nuclease QatD [Hyphomonas oceanitis]|uniref:Qat anti-phage system TatD family nuclease QatD n=1 Tax=Hyphomonas oceanitis TaxID=81033 RepID=UPI0030020B71|tara:strand:+ start:4319 stop:5065 length:747 start_codon:yes stop_codon:yes gene_type:complete
MMDFHCHLDLYDNPQEVIRQATEAGTYVLSVTTTPKAFPGTKRLSANSPRIRTALGLHPQLAADRYSELNLFDLMLSETQYVGEIGLDGSTEFKSSLPIQSKVFRHILESCDRSGGKVLSIHSRNAAGRVLQHLSEAAGSSTSILHWFSGSSQDTAIANDLGCWFSVGPAMVRAKSGRERVSQMPIEKVLLETDGPFAMQNGKPLVPAQSELCIPILAEIWGVSKTTTRQQLADNLKAIGVLARSVGV